MKSITERFVNYAIIESELLTPLEHGGKFTTEQRQFILDELNRVAKEFTDYNAALIKNSNFKLFKVKGR